MRVGVATTSRLAADAGAEIAEEGGNAVDVAIAASLVSLVSEPGMVSLAGGGFMTIWPGNEPMNGQPNGEPVTIDGAVAMPGLGSSISPEQASVRRVVLEYAGGMETLIGHGSVAVPGILAAFDVASRNWGRVSWEKLFAPAIIIAREGFPLPSGAHRYMMHAHKLIYGWDPASYQALHTAEGLLKPVGDQIKIERLADTLEMIATEGVAAFYRGEIGQAMADCISARGGLLTRDDLAAYKPAIRKPITQEIDGWTIATAPPPSLGGTVLAAMLTLCADRRFERGDEAATDHLVRVQLAMLAHRFEVLDLTPELETRAEELLALVPNGLDALQSPSTVHTSATDAQHMACSITVSSGYGSGVMPPGTGVWMNNCLGELELNRRGMTGWQTGQRLYSNMAPSVARRRDGTTLAIGSPGADRITTAQLQVILNHAFLGMPLETAIAQPRLHVEHAATEPRVAFEPGLPVDRLDYVHRAYDKLDAFFGGVGAVRFSDDQGFDLAADPRRVGATALAGED